MCMLAFAVCVSHFPVILGSGPTRWSRGKSPGSPATPIASSMWIRCPGDTGMLREAIDAPAKMVSASAEILRNARVGRTPSTSSCSTAISITRPIFRGCSKPCARTSAARPRRRRALQLVLRLAVPACRSARLAAGPADHHLHHASGPRAARPAGGIRARPPASGCVLPWHFFGTRFAVERRDAGGSGAPLVVARHGRRAAAEIVPSVRERPSLTS